MVEFIKFIFIIRIKLPLDIYYRLTIIKNVNCRNN